MDYFRIDSFNSKFVNSSKLYTMIFSANICFDKKYFFNKIFLVFNKVNSLSPDKFLLLKKKVNQLIMKIDFSENCFQDFIKVQVVI